MSATSTAPPDVLGLGDVVDLEVPATPAYVTVVRAATAGLAARVDLTLDRIEDLRIAVDEACALLVHDPSRRAPDDVLHCRFTLADASLTVEVTGPPTPLPPPTAFAWAMLSALVDGLETGQGAADGSGCTWLRLVVRRQSGAWG